MIIEGNSLTTGGQGTPSSPGAATQVHVLNKLKATSNAASQSSPRAFTNAVVSQPTLTQSQFNTMTPNTSAQSQQNDQNNATFYQAQQQISYSPQKLQQFNGVLGTSKPLSIPHQNPLSPKRQQFPLPVVNSGPAFHVQGNSNTNDSISPYRLNGKLPQPQPSITTQGKKHSYYKSQSDQLSMLQQKELQKPVLKHANTNEDDTIQEVNHNLTSSQPLLEVLNTPAAGILPDLLQDDELPPDHNSNTLFNHYGFDKQSTVNDLEQQDTQQREQNEMEEDEKAIDDLDYSDQQYYIKKENEEENELERQSNSSSESDREEQDGMKERMRGFEENPEETMSTQQHQSAAIPNSANQNIDQSRMQSKITITMDPKKPIGTPATNVGVPGDKATLKVNGADPNIREVRYTVYGENLEQTLKLLCCQKSISLIDKKDPKYRRMFITAFHQKPEKKTQTEDDKPSSATLKVVVPDGQGGPSKKLIQAIEQVYIYQPKTLINAQVIDMGCRQQVFGPLKKIFETIHLLGFRYTGLDTYKECLLVDLQQKPLKKKKKFTFQNPDNLVMIKSPADNLLPINGGGMRQLLQEYDNYMARIISQKLQKIKIQRSSTNGIPGGKYSNAANQPLYAQQRTKNLNQLTATQQINSKKQQIIQGNSNQDHLVEPYKRFRYNFHYWLKNFKYNDDGTFQFVINENQNITGTFPMQQALQMTETPQPQVKPSSEVKIENNSPNDQTPCRVKGSQMSIAGNNTSSPVKLVQNPKPSQIIESGVGSVDMTPNGNETSHNSQKKNFFILGPNGVSNLTQTNGGELQMQSYSKTTGVVQQQQIGKTSLTLGLTNEQFMIQNSLHQKKPNTSDPQQQIIDQLMQLKKHQEEVKRRRFKPASSPLGNSSGIGPPQSGKATAHSNHPGLSGLEGINRGSTQNSPTKKISQDRMRMTGMGMSNDQDSLMQLENSLNFRGLKVARNNPAANGNVLQKTTTSESHQQNPSIAEVNNSFGRHSRHSQNLKFEPSKTADHSNINNLPISQEQLAAIQLLAQTQTSKWNSQGNTNNINASAHSSVGSRLPLSKAHMQGNQNYLTPADSISNNIFPVTLKPTEQIINGYDTLRFKPQPHSSVLAGGFNQQEIFSPQNGMTAIQETVSTPNMNHLQNKFKKGQMSARPINIDELISTHLFQQQQQLHQSHQYHSAVIKRGSNDISNQTGKKAGANNYHAGGGSTLPNKKQSIIQQSTIQAQAQAQAMLNAAQVSQSPDKNGKEAAISNLYQLMKLGGGNLNTVMMAKNPNVTNNQQSQNQINQKNNTINDYQARQIQHRQSFKAGITISSSGTGCGTKDAVNIGTSSIRSLKTIDNSSSSKALNQQPSGVIHQHILPLTNTHSRTNLVIDDKQVVGYHHHQRQVSMPMQQQSAGAGFAFVSNGETSTNDYSQYPPGTIFFDKLKRKSTAIINFMNFMSSSSTTNSAGVAGGNLVMPQLRNNNGMSGTTTPNKQTNAPAGRSTPAILTK